MAKRNIKESVKAKAKSTKAKVKSKLKKVSACVAILLVVCGCATSEPASRATTARYGDIVVRIGEGAKGNKVTLTIGDGALASADSSGSTETMTSSPTNEVKPDIDVSVPVNKAGAAQSVGSVLGDAVASLVSGIVSKKTDSSNGSSADCTDGSCSYGACTDGSCSVGD